MDLCLWSLSASDLPAGCVPRCVPQFLGTLVCSSVTLPTGALIPSFKVGVAIGRLLGELYCTYRLSVCGVNPAVASESVAEPRAATGT